MKKSVTFLTIIILSLFLSCCSTRCDYQFVQAESDIKTIEVVNVIDYVDIFDEDYDSFEVIAVVDSGLKEDFLSDFRNIACYRYHGDRVEYIDGYAIRIIYNDDAYELIDKETVYYETADGQWKFSPYHFDNEAFDSFLRSYVTD